MNRCSLLVFSVVAVAVCSGCTSGLVLKQDKDQCNYIVNVSEILTVYGKSSSASRKIEGKAQNVPIEATASSDKSKSVVVLAKMLDQINSQSYPFLLTAIAAKNMNPCDAGTDKRFWATLNNLINKAYGIRNKAVKLRSTEKYSKGPKAVIDNKDDTSFGVYDYLKGYEYFGK